MSTLIRSKLRGPHRARVEPGLDRGGQQRLQSLWSEPLAPAGERARIARQLMLEILAAAEPLPVRVLDPALHHGFIGQVESMLEIGQPDHQPGGFGRPSERTIEAAELVIEAVPVDQTWPGERARDADRGSDRDGCGRDRRSSASSAWVPWQNTGFEWVTPQEPAFYNASRRRRILQPQSVVGCSGPTNETAER